jgi:hypothetical protein
MAVPKFTLAFIADADSAPYLIAKVGSVDGNFAIAAASTDKLLGVLQNVQVAAGQVGDVIIDGSANVTYGGTVAFGDWLTSDSSGRAITAAPSTGVNAWVIGIAQESGVVGDIRPVMLHIGKIQG